MIDSSEIVVDNNGGAMIIEDENLADDDYDTE